MNPVDNLQYFEVMVQELQRRSCFTTKIIKNQDDSKNIHQNMENRKTEGEEVWKCKRNKTFVGQIGNDFTLQKKDMENKMQMH